MFKCGLMERRIPTGKESQWGEGKGEGRGVGERREEERGEERMRRGKRKERERKSNVYTQIFIQPCFLNHAHLGIYVGRMIPMHLFLISFLCARVQNKQNHIHEHFCVSK